MVSMQSFWVKCFLKEPTYKCLFLPDFMAALLVNTALLSLPVSSNGVDGDFQTILGSRCHSAGWDCWTVHHYDSCLCYQRLESDPINHSCFMCCLFYIYMVRTFSFVPFVFYYTHWSIHFEQVNTRVGQVVANQRKDRWSQAVDWQSGKNQQT